MPNTKSMKITLYTLAIIAGFTAAAIAGPGDPGWQYGVNNCTPADGMTTLRQCNTCCDSAPGLTFAEVDDCKVFCDQIPRPGVVGGILDSVGDAFNGVWVWIFG